METEKPQWMVEHEGSDRKAFEGITKALARIEDKLDPENKDYMLKNIETTLGPISDTYTTVSRLGTWGMASLVAVSMIVGILYTAWQFLSAFRK